MRSLVVFILVVSPLSVFAQGVLQFECFNLTKGAPKTALLSAQVMDAASNRLVSDILESRTASDVEFISTGQVAQYKGNAKEAFFIADDLGATGTVQAILNTTAVVRKIGDTAIARYVGTYKRLTPGRLLNVKVECAVRR